MRFKIFAAALLAVVTAGCFGIEPPPPPPTTTTSSTIPSAQPSFPIHAAFYYPWFPEAWNQQGFDPFTWYTPTLGFYDSSNASTIATHIAQMRYAGMDAGIASWWGQGSDTDNRIPLLLQGASGTPFRWSLYYEPEGQSNPTVTQLNSDLTYILQHYGSDPSYLRIGGRPAIFVYAQPTDACGMVTRWVQANARRFYVVLKVFTGYKTCTDQPDAWHQYGPAVATSDVAGNSFSVSPGFWKRTEATPRLARDPARFASNVQSMIASNEKFQLVTTFNEWGEGTAVEPATQWASASGYGTYLDILHQYLAH